MGTRGYTVQAELEAGSITAVGQLARKHNAGVPHDKIIPVKAFQRDLVRKVALRKVMGKKKKDDEPPPAAMAEVLAKDKDALIPGTQFMKEEVNYRYSGDLDHMCGSCSMFEAPSACSIVAGLINRVDVCNRFEPLHAARGDGQGGVVKSELIPNENTLGEVHRPKPGALVVQAVMAEDWGDDDEEGDCADDEKDVEGHCPDDPLFDDSTAGMYDPDSFLSDREVSPPGWSGTTKAMKKHKDITNPFALAWWAAKRGEKPHYAPEKKEGGPGSGRRSGQGSSGNASQPVCDKCGTRHPANTCREGIPVGKLVTLRQSEGVMSVMGQSHPISNMPASSSGKYKHPANRKVAGARRWGH